MLTSRSSSATLLITLALGLFLAPFSADAQRPSKVPRIGVLWNQFPAPEAEAFRQAILSSRRAEILEFAARSRLPTMWGAPAHVEAGGLMAYGVNYRDSFRRAATYVSKILKGARPADLPIEQPMKFDFVINLKTAQALGLTIPPSILLQATEVIQ